MQSKKKFSCIIVDDKELDRLVIASHARKYPFIEILGSFASAEEALGFTQTTAPDILFLDIDMPGMNGLELRKQLEHIPVCIFITAHPEFALESFETTAFDFLVKPLKADRFEKAMARMESYLDLLQKAALLDFTLGEDTIFIKDGHTHIKLQLYEIIYLEALKDYTGIITREKKYSVLSPIGNLLKENAFKNFIRIHRSYAVQKHFITTITTRDLLVNNTLLPIGRSYKAVVEKLLIH
jgi:DNA-binding LytR/AlgR family response regulator